MQYGQAEVLRESLPQRFHRPGLDVLRLTGKLYPDARHRAAPHRDQAHCSR